MHNYFSYFLYCCFIIVYTDTLMLKIFYFCTINRCVLFIILTLMHEDGNQRQESPVQNYSWWLCYFENQIQLDNQLTNLYIWIVQLFIVSIKFYNFYKKVVFKSIWPWYPTTALELISGPAERLRSKSDVTTTFSCLYVLLSLPVLLLHWKINKIII